MKQVNNRGQARFASIETFNKLKMNPIAREVNKFNNQNKQRYLNQKSTMNISD